MFHRNDVIFQARCLFSSFFFFSFLKEQDDSVLMCLCSRGASVCDMILLHLVILIFIQFLEVYSGPCRPAEGPPAPSNVAPLLPGICHLK